MHMKTSNQSGSHLLIDKLIRIAHVIAAGNSFQAFFGERSLFYDTTTRQHHRREETGTESAP